MELLYERGSHALNELKEIDKYWKQLQNIEFSKTRPIVTKMEKTLNKLLSTTVVFELHNVGPFRDNFAVLPILKQGTDLTRSNMLNPTSIKLYEVEMIYFLVGTDLINESKPRQLTAILLHEIGHVVQHITRTAAMIDSVLHKTKFISDVMSRFPIINLVFTPLFIITSRTLNFRNHAYEYDADKFAVRYGYGDDLAEWGISQLSSNDSIPVSTLGIIYRIKQLFEGSSHPSFKKRLKEVINEMKNNYSKQYGSKKIDKLLNQYYKI